VPIPQFKQVRYGIVCGVLWICQLPGQGIGREIDQSPLVYHAQVVRTGHAHMHAYCLVKGHSLTFLSASVLCVIQCLSE
jgi:hypothetical protein